MSQTLSLVHTVRPAAPGANNADDQPPLLLLLHGVGANEQQMSALAPTFDPRFIVVSARSPIALGPTAFAWFHVTFTPNGPSINAGEAAAGWAHVARFAEEATQAYGADPARVFVGGFSQGAIMALAAMLTAPERFAGAFAMSGRLLPEVLPHAASLERLRGKPVLIVHGTSDEKLGVHFARSARQELEQRSLALDYHELTMGHAVTRESLSAVTGWLSGLLGHDAHAEDRT